MPVAATAMAAATVISSSSMIRKPHITSARLRRPGSASKTATKSKLSSSTTIVNHDYIIIIDTETTGLFSRNATPENYELFNNARMVEIAWEIYTPVGDLINRESYLIKPNGFIIPENVIAIHGITNEMAHEHGHAIQDVISRLEIVLKDVSTIVAHNLAFDNAIILAELYRLNTESDGLNKYSNLIYDWMIKEHKCTMMMSKNIIANTCKWYKLGDLYRICFNSEPVGVLHRAAADVEICAKIYFHLLRRSVID